MARLRVVLFGASSAGIMWWRYLKYMNVMRVLAASVSAVKMSA